VLCVEHFSHGFDPTGIGAVLINKASFSTTVLETEPGAGEISLSQSDNKLSVKIGGRTVTTLAAGEFQQVIIRLTNGVDKSGSPVVFPSIATVTLARQD
jgi:hypothetical protein